MNHSFNIEEAESGKLQNIVSKECLNFVFDLYRFFNPIRLHLLEERKIIQKKIDDGWTPNFLDETRHIRESVRCLV